MKHLYEVYSPSISCFLCLIHQFLCLIRKKDSFGEKIFQYLFNLVQYLHKVSNLILKNKSNFSLPYTPQCRMANEPKILTAAPLRHSNNIDRFGVRTTGKLCTTPCKQKVTIEE